MLLVLRGRTAPLQARAAVFMKGRQKVPPLARQLSKQHRFIAELARTTTACRSRVGWYPRGPLWLSAREARPVLVDFRWYSSGEQYYRKSNDPQDQQDDDDGEPQKNSHWNWLLWVPWIYVAWILYTNSNKEPPIPEVYFPSFIKHMLMTGEVKHLEVAYGVGFGRAYIHLHPGATYNGKKVRPYGPQFFVSISSIDQFEAKVTAVQDELGIPPHDRVPITYRDTVLLGYLVMSGLAAIAVLGFVFWYIMSRRSGSFQSSGVDTLNPFSYMMRARTTIITEPSQTGAKMSEVAGMEEAKREVAEFVDYLKSPKRFSDLGARIPKGALLHGPPGTGKTLLARAIASEAAVPFITIAGPDFVEMFAGVGSARVRSLFEQARSHAPCIVYIDEIDAVGKSRKSSAAFEGHGEQESTLNQLLVEMDGINPLEGVVMLASTNRVDVLDQALLRPGRFDRQIAINLPTLLERKAIFEVYLKKLVLEKTVEQYSSRLAALTPGHSGADIANIVNEAALHAAREKGEQVSAKNFEYAIERVIAGMEKKSNVMGDDERKIVAYHEAGHALLSWLLEHTDPVLKVSIVPRTKGPLGFSQHLPSDQKLYTTEQLTDRMCANLGGRAAEAITFRKITTGAQDDLEKVTKMAYKQVVEYGMSPVIGHVSYPQTNPKEPFKKLYSQKLAAMIDKEAKLLVSSAYQRAEKILRENSDKLQKLAEALLKKEVLNYNDIVEVLGDMPHKKAHHSELEDLWQPD